MRAVGLAILIGVLKNDDAVTFRATVLILAIIDLGHPDPPFGIGIHVGGVQKHRACRPSSDFEIIRHGICCSPVGSADWMI